MPLISIVIAVHNGGTDLERCLSGVDAITYPNREFILVDDASTDGMASRGAESRDVRLIRLDNKSGPAFARNVGATHAKGDILFFTDADVVLEPQVLSIAARIMGEDDCVAAVFGSYDDTPGHPAFLSQYRNLLHHWVHQTSLADAFSFWSGCGAVKKRVFDELGGFSTGYTAPSIEDIEFGVRVRRAGHAIRLEKSMQCKHLKHWQFGTMVRTDLFLRAIPWMILILREREFPMDLNLDPGSRVATAAAGLLALCLGWLLVSGQVSAWLPTLTLLFIAVLVGISPVTAPERSAKRKQGLIMAAVLAIAAFGAIVNPLALLPISLLALLVLARHDFYRFLYRKRNAAFALAAVPMQFVHFLECAIAVPIGFYKHLRLRRTPNGVQASPDQA